MVWSVLIKLVDLWTGKADRRRAFVSAQAEPIQVFAAAHFEYLDQLLAILSVWGEDAPYTHAQRSKAVIVSTRMLADLSGKGRAARWAAEQIGDAELTYHLNQAEAHGATLCQRIESSMPSTRAGHLVDQLQRAHKANRQLSDRLRRLLT